MLNTAPKTLALVAMALLATGCAGPPKLTTLKPFAGEAPYLSNIAQITYDHMGFFNAGHRLKLRRATSSALGRRLDDTGQHFAAAQTQLPTQTVGHARVRRTYTVVLGRVSHETARLAVGLENTVYLIRHAETPVGFRLLQDARMRQPYQKRGALTPPRNRHNLRKFGMLRKNTRMPDGAEAAPPARLIGQCWEENSTAV